MAHVVCQVLVQPDWVVFVWSEGAASFAPYALVGPDVARFHSLMGQANDRLKQLARLQVDRESKESQAVGLALAQTGHDLHQLIFAAEATHEIRDWLEGLTARREIDSLEIVSDAAQVFPWTILYDQPPDEAAFRGEDGWQGFWGYRYNLTSARRVHPLRQQPVLDKPRVLLAVDPDLRMSLPDDEQQRLTSFVQTHDLPLVESAGRLKAELADAPPDLLYLFCRADGDDLGIGTERVRLDDLHAWLRGEDGDAGKYVNTLVFANLGAQGAQSTSACLLERLQLFGFSAVLGNMEAAPAGGANRCGLEILADFLYTQQPLGAVVQKRRGREVPHGLLYTVCCPPQVRVRWTEDAESPLTPAPLPRSEGEGRAEPQPLPDKPYRPLAPFEREERALFVGRDADVAEFSQLLDEPGARLVLLHGACGVGKSSLLRAGVIPLLEEACLGYRVLRDRAEVEEAEIAEDELPVLTVRATGDVQGQFALALTHFCARPYAYRTPAGKTVTIDLPALLRQCVGGPAGAATDTAITTQPSPASPAPPPLPTLQVSAEDLRQALRSDPALLARLLAALAEKLPHEPVLVIEHGEELFSLSSRVPNPSFRRKGLEMLGALAEHAGRGKVILSLRTEYYGRLLHHLEQTVRQDRIRTYLLRELNEAAMLEALLLPTSLEEVAGCAEIPYQKYRFVYEEGLVQDLVRDARRSRAQSTLALLQAICARLVEVIETRPERVIRAADLTRIGGVEDGLLHYVRDRIRFVTRRLVDRRALAQLVESLHIRQPDGLLTRDLVPVPELAQGWHGATPLEAVVDAAAADHAGLLEWSWLNVAGTEGPYISLAHDALAGTSADLAEDARKYKHGRRRIVDTLWIMVPLLILTAVGAFWLVRRLGSETLQESIAETENKELVLLKEKLEGEISTLRLPAYTGQLYMAHQAFQVGDLVRYRQFLKTQLPLTPQEDLRGFEWYYLMRLGSNERHSLPGHTGTVLAVALSPNGKMLASAGVDGTVRLWDVEKGLARATLVGHQGAVHAVAFSKDGKLVASAGEDKTIKLWSANLEKEPHTVTTEPLATITGHDGRVQAVGFGHDDKYLASAGGDQTLRLWSVASPDKVSPAANVKTKGVLHALSFGPDGKTLASAGADPTVIVWDTSDPSMLKEKHTLKSSAGVMHAAAFSADGKILACAGGESHDGLDQGAVRLWDVATGKELRTWRAPATVFAIAFAADNNNTLVTCGKDNAVHFWDTATGAPLGNLRGHLGWVRCVALSADGQTLATGSYDSYVKLWEPKPAAEQDVLDAHKEGVWCVTFSADDKRLATGGADKSVKIWNTDTGKLEATLTGHKDAVYAVAFTRDGKRLASAGADQAIKLWDVDPTSNKKYTELAGLTGHKKAVHALAISGELLASASADHTVKLWDIAGKPEAFGKKEPRTLSKHTAPVRCLAFHEISKARLLASGGDDHAVMLWDADEGKHEVTLKGHTSAVTAVAFWPGTAYLVSGGMDRTLKSWDLRSSKDLRTIRGHGAGVTGLAFSPSDRSSYVSAGADHTLKLWDTNQDTERFTLRGHSGPVTAVAFANDARTIASASHDGTIRLWRAAERQPLLKHP